MPTSNETCTATVERYIAMLNDGQHTGIDFVALYADGATIEDPVGSTPLSGAEAIAQFYDAIPAQRSAVLTDIRTVAGEVVFAFDLNLSFPDNKMTIRPIDHMRINEDGKIASMRAFWSDDNVSFG
ncbi:MAG TPA: nuclear transport factor 2 family protein [Marmoricola sp.]|nr:nuclear transport factor 2 family protein [Marmoricola sp.]